MDEIRYLPLSEYLERCYLAGKDLISYIALSEDIRERALNICQHLPEYKRAAKKKDLRTINKIYDEVRERLLIDEIGGNV